MFVQIHVDVLRRGFEHGGGGERSGIKLVEAERGTHEPKKNPCTDNDKDRGIGEFIEPEEQALLSHVEFNCFLSNGH